MCACCIWPGTSPIDARRSRLLAWRFDASVGNADGRCCGRFDCGRNFAAREPRSYISTRPHLQLWPGSFRERCGLGPASCTRSTTVGRRTGLANRMTYRLNDEVIAVSSDVAESIPTALRSRVDVIEHGVDVAAIAAHQDRAAARRTFRVDEDHFVVGIVANCRHEKDLETLVGAVAAVDRRRPDSKIVVVHIGQGPLADDLDRWVIDAGVGDRLRRLGRREDAAALMSGFDAFTLSSRHEGLPVALMEAAANGLPMVCTNVGGVAAVCRDGINGVLVASADPEALADAWMSLAVDADECERMARESSRIAAEFDVHRAVAEIEDRYGRTSRPSPVAKGEA